MKGFILLMSFMTRLYVPKVEYDEEKLGKAMKFFPIVGFIIGIILFLTDILVKGITLNDNVAIIFIILVDVILTGAIHLDGLADTFDGIFSYRSKQKMLEIMKDSRIGTNGVIALIMYFMLKFFLLQSIIEIDGITYIPIFAYPIISRYCSVVSCATAPYARASGMGKTFVDNTNKKSVFISFIATFLLLMILTSASTFVDFLYFKEINLNLFFSRSLFYFSIMIFMTIVATLFSKLMTRKIGGITGDTLGALLELSQLLYLLILLGIY